MGRPTATLCKATELLESSGPAGPARWERAALNGILTELVGGPRSANVSVASRLIFQAQTAGEQVAWVATHRDVFFPPDIAAAGVDLAALPVVWTEDGPAADGPAEEPVATGRRHAGRAVRTAEQLLRSGAFGLIIIDLAKNLTLDAAGQGRLLHLAEHNDAQVLIIRRKREDGAYSGSLVTVRVESSREQIGPGRFRCTITNTKDKREGPGWTTSEEFDGPPGLY